MRWPFPFLLLLLVVVCAAGIAQAESAAGRVNKPSQPKRYVITIENLKFKPASIQISPGDTVVWVNNDDCEHNISAKDGSFTSGNLASGKAFEHKFDKAGSVDYDDDLHPRMHGTVIVKAK